jgi:hypothetical protein
MEFQKAEIQGTDEIEAKLPSPARRLTDANLNPEMRLKELEC